MEEPRSQTRNPTVLVQNMLPNTPVATKLDLEKLLERGFDHGHVAWEKIVCPVDYGAYNVSTHGYVYYNDAEDASRVQQYLHGMKVAGTLISAILILPDDTTLTAPIKKKNDEVLLAYDMFPDLPQSDKSDKSDKSENYNIFDIMEEDTSWLTEETVKIPIKPAVKKEINRNKFCLECNTYRHHETFECPSLRSKVRNQKCPYCHSTGHILWAKYPVKNRKFIMCPKARSTPTFR
jgi:hypothetical protein